MSGCAVCMGWRAHKRHMGSRVQRAHGGCVLCIWAAGCSEHTVGACYAYMGAASLCERAGFMGGAQRNGRGSSMGRSFKAA